MPEPSWTLDRDRADAVTLNARSLRGLAHPVRLRLLSLLRTDGPSTATRLAERLGLNSGATSYHLRQLAEHGFVIEDESRGNGRDRWWRAAHRSTWFDRTELDEESATLGEAYLRAVAAVYAEQTQRHLDEAATLPVDWRSASTISDFALRLTAEETEGLLEDLAAVIARYRPDDPQHVADPPPGTVPVALQVQAFPRPGLLAPEDQR